MEPIRRLMVGYERRGGVHEAFLAKGGILDRASFKTGFVKYS